jgi:hypothetical protein
MRPPISGQDHDAQEFILEVNRLPRALACFSGNPVDEG